MLKHFIGIFQKSFVQLVEHNHFAKILKRSQCQNQHTYHSACIGVIVTKRQRHVTHSLRHRFHGHLFIIRKPVILINSHTQNYINTKGTVWSQYALYTQIKHSEWAWQYLSFYSCSIYERPRVSYQPAHGTSYTNMKKKLVNTCTTVTTHHVEGLTLMVKHQFISRMYMQDFFFSFTNMSVNFHYLFYTRWFD